MSPAQALAADLGYAEQTLDNWLRQDEADRGERARLPERERTHRMLCQDREILKHAAACLAWVGDRL